MTKRAELLAVVQSLQALPNAEPQIGVDAILAVLETPTEGMLEAAWSVRRADDLADATWGAMIRAIRDEATETEKS